MSLKKCLLQELISIRLGEIEQVAEVDLIDMDRLSLVHDRLATAPHIPIGEDLMPAAVAVLQDAFEQRDVVSLVPTSSSGLDSELVVIYNG